MSYEAREVKTITIRWKPYMWWAYVNDDADSNIHGEPEDLVRMLSNMWPDAEISVDWASMPSASVIAYIDSMLSKAKA